MASGIFGCPDGEVTIEVPDGVSKTMSPEGTVHNSLTNSDFAMGGPDACGYGAFPQGDDGNVTSIRSGQDSKKFRID